MAREIKCSHCGSSNVSFSGEKHILSCKNRGGLTDLAPNRFWTKVAGYTAGSAIGFLTLGLLPDEVQDSIADGIANGIDDLIS